MMSEHAEVERNYLEEGGLQFVSQGKVRDTYALPDHDDLLLFMTSNRISSHDFVLSAEVPGKGQLLNAMSIFWKTKVLQNVCANDIVAFGSGIDEYLPEPLQGDMDAQSRGVIARKLKMLPIECVVRGHLTGGGWRSYRKDRTVCGVKLPPDLHDGSQLPHLIFTPTTKAQQGHDEPLDSGEVT
ncbi:MAG: phosphoribosylaminoimidazolesuccinocarboxamide synthase, partial [Candidatus Komeilibacteria bacterium]|nr:phosphoribosylaminoimidazolesuccinocarboxamide synthase [Candidatus Komeilibacteria bacterium]